MASSNEQLTAQELEQINAVYDLVESSNGLVYADDIKNIILNLFNSNSQKILTSDASPLNIILNAVVKQTQLKCADIAYYVSKMLYTQSSGDDLSLASANFGFERIEAKPSSINVNITASKDVTLPIGTSFTDGLGNIWLSQDNITIPKNSTQSLNLKSKEFGKIIFLSPINLTKSVSGVDTIEVDTKSIVVGSEQETDADLKANISMGIQIPCSDPICQRELQKLDIVDNVFVITNPFKNTISQIGTDIDSRARYISIRLFNENLTQDNALLIAQTIVDNTLFNPIFQKPKDLKIKSFYGITEDLLTKPINEGGAGLIGIDNTSNCILVRNSQLYGNFIDVYFYLAKPVNIDVLLELKYDTSFNNISKASINTEIQQAISEIVANLSQIGTPLLISDIITNFNKTSYKDQVEITSCWLRKNGTTDRTQNLQAEIYEYFQLNNSVSNPYSSILITESGL